MAKTPKGKRQPQSTTRTTKTASTPGECNPCLHGPTQGEALGKCKNGSWVFVEDPPNPGNDTVLKRDGATGVIYWAAAAEEFGDLMARFLAGEFRPELLAKLKGAAE